jgi:GNAT superfamily N-acetyltransferase
MLPTVKGARPMTISFVTTSAQPGLVPLVVDWLREEFWHAGSPPRDRQIATMLAQPAQSEETFVLLDDNEPVGTASLVNDDLPSRPDLTPWLASVLVLPRFRGKGYSALLVRRVEEEAALSATRLWLYTWSAETVYAKLGWHRVGPSRDEARGIDVILMKRDLSGS